VRLKCVRDGDSFKHKLIFFVIKLQTRRPPPDVVKTLMYRSSFFGKWLSSLTQSAMRGPSDWSIAERELFAAHASKLNQCVF
jgi:hypothetical protein